MFTWRKMRIQHWMDRQMSVVGQVFAGTLMVFTFGLMIYLSM